MMVAIRAVPRTASLRSNGKVVSKFIFAKLFFCGWNSLLVFAIQMYQKQNSSTIGLQHFIYMHVHREQVRSLDYYIGTYMGRLTFDQIIDW